jgi:hypothetical protein
MADKRASRSVEYSTLGSVGLPFGVAGTIFVHLGVVTAHGVCALYIETILSDGLKLRHIYNKFQPLLPNSPFVQLSFKI